MYLEHNTVNTTQVTGRGYLAYVGVKMDHRYPAIS